VSEMILKIRM